MPTLQQVHLRVSDAANGKPTPCRVRFTDADGKYYAPHGRLTEFATARGIDVGSNVLSLQKAKDGTISSVKFAYIDGGCEIALPPGPLHVTICKGPEYRPLRQEISLAAGKLAMRFVLERWSDVRQQGWYPGDIRCHFLQPHAALLEGAGEDLAVVNLLAMQCTVWDDHDGWSPEADSLPAMSNLLAFSGQQPALEQPGCLVVVNTHNTHPRLGSLALLNSHRVVYPLGFGWRTTGDDYDNWTLADWCEQCHRKRGLVIWTKAFLQPGHKKQPESLADLILGRVDAVEVERFGGDEQQHPWSFYWYDLLNCGLRVPLAGGSGKQSNCLPLGCVRTYARLQPDQALTYQNWIEAIRAGRTFATNGPLLLLTVNGQDPGAVIQIPSYQPVAVRAEARSLEPFEHLELIANGKVVAHQTPGGNPMSAQIETDVALPEGGWLAARCWGKSWLPGALGGQRIYAHTSPVYIRVEGRQPTVDPAAARGLLEHLDISITWVENEGRYENDAQQDRLAGIFREARRVLERKLVALQG